jgi:uncharacterized repeat protein (TIGR04052 family)
MELAHRLFIVSAALAVAGCGGGSSSSPETATVSGTLVDGYIAGATVCVDTNKNAQCDAGEPVSAATGTDGQFVIDGVASTDASGAPLVAVVPATAIDSDTSTAVGSGFVLSAPAGKTIVSPLTTLAQQVILKDPSKTPEAAAGEIKSYVTSLASTDLYANYVASSDANAHAAAKVVANSLKANYDGVKGYATGNDKNLAVVLSEVAKQALQSQGLTPDPTKPVGVEDVNSLRASVASLSTTAAATQDVTISLDMVNAGTPVRCGDAITVANSSLWDHAADTLLPTPTAQTTAGQLVDTRFYVSNVLLLDASGNAVPLVMADSGANQSAKGVTLLDFGHDTAASGSPVACTTSYTTQITGKVVPGTYTGISFTVGVPIRSMDFAAKLNHTNTADTVTAPQPLQVSAMAWSWQSGRKFTKIEFMPTTAIDKIGATTTTKWNVHIGSTGCAGDPTVATNETTCTNPNRLAVKFDSFNAATQKIAFDVGQLFKDADVSFEGGGAVGCMSGTTDPECGPIFKALGLDLATGKVLGGTQSQSVFKVQ